MRFLILLGLLTAGGAALAQPAEAPKADQPAYSIVEPKAPPKAKAAVRKRAAKANARAVGKSREKPPVLARAEETLKPNGRCVIKPVMSDQDLVNCGATPHH
jgi:precorrin-6B methylase 2